MTNSAPVTLANVELTLEMNAPAFHAAQVSNVPNIFIAPISPMRAVTTWEGGSLDKDGKTVNRVVATPEQIQTIKDYAQTQRFSVKAHSLFNDVPVTIVLLGAGPNPYTIGKWTFGGSLKSTLPTAIRLVGSYEVQYKNNTFKMPVKVERIRR